MAQRVSTFVEGFHEAAACARMPYRALRPWREGEATEPRISALGLGGSPFGDVYGEVPQESVDAVVECAIRGGVNVIDTAYWYGQGASESRLGKALQKIPREAYYLHSKCGRYEKDVRKMFDFSAERTLRAVDEALRRLGVEYLDCMQIHDPEYAPSLDVILEETLPALQKAKDAGKIRKIGITGYPLALHRELLKRSTVQIDTCLFYCHYSLNDTSLFDDQELFTLLRDKDVGWLNASPISMGLLSGGDPPKWHPASAEVKTACQTAAKICREKSVSLPKLAIDFALRNTQVPCTLSGAATKEIMQANLETAYSAGKLSGVEQEVQTELRERVFATLSQPSWEGVEVAQYHELLQRAKETGEAGATLSTN
ncbi:L-galactose dehydrogenase [Hondaea fermentalgiana]|uniref:L-galactose dehydrogenase n=1 Tax=Hondaea fermentalgiana TaxID=2315210 RepID=A0A2R5GZ44_9STRA|nr:L-galactose dehydrogenase [Hondaea fermentalgiana]|eukprot:GBG34023.1 L-galactose dehydrogenase [Hondaea fermentalgiana]